MFVFANVLQPLIDVTEEVLVFFHDNVGFGWGVSIIALTVVVRLVLLPLTLKQFKSMQELQRLQPHIKELQEKYKDDRQRLNQEMMRFYQEHKVNPLGSCLPLLLQMPIFIALFYMLRIDLKHDICPDIRGFASERGRKVEDISCDQVDPGSAEFLFIPDLTHKATGGVLITLIVLYVGSQLVSSLLMTVTADKNQRRLFAALPILFVPFIIQFPAGLIVYWITTNLWTIVQQYIVRKTVGPLKPPELPGLGKKAPAPAPALAGGGKGGGDGKASGDGEESGDGKARSGPPPPPPRRKKKQRSGRRR
jgi:YidC/Oxa1 family membrane protein insertase